MHIVKWKKQIWNDYVLYDSNYMTFWKRQSYGDRKKIIGCQKFWERKGLEKWSIGDYQRLVKYWWGVLLVYVLMDPIGHIWTYWLTTSCYLVIKLCQMTPMDYSLPGSSVHGISQARILEWVAISFSRGSSQPGDRTCILFIGGQILEPPEKPQCAFIKFIKLEKLSMPKGFQIRLEIWIIFKSKIHK